MFFLVLSYGISITLLQILSSLRFHPVKGVHWGVLEKSYLKIRKHPSWCFKKTTTLHTFQRNIRGWVLFKYTCRPFWNYFKKLFRAAILQTGIYPTNLDVRYLVQKKQSFKIEFWNWILIYIYIFLFVCLQ